jgi:hypothetical protein
MKPVAMTAPLLAAAALADLEQRLSFALQNMGIVDGQLQPDVVATAASPASSPASSGDDEAQPATIVPVQEPALIDPPEPGDTMLAQGAAAAVPVAGFHARNVSDFFAVLAARRDADGEAGRLAFWSRYLQQVTWTRLVVGGDTLALQQGDTAVRDLLAHQIEGHATVTGDQGQDALMMVINGHLIVEFAKLPQAAYIYSTVGIKFDCHASTYSADIDDLTYGYREFGHRDGKARRITHIPGWQQDAGAQLKRIGIVPDIPLAQRMSTATRQSAAAAFPMPLPTSLSAWIRDVPAPLPVTVAAPPHELAPAGAKFTMAALAALVQRFEKASMNDQRAGMDGCLWVMDPIQRRVLASALMEHGFRWNSTRMAWYYSQPAEQR